MLWNPLIPLTHEPFSKYSQSQEHCHRWNSGSKDFLKWGKDMYFRWNQSCAERRLLVCRYVWWKDVEKLRCLVSVAGDCGSKSILLNFQRISGINRCQTATSREDLKSKTLSAKFQYHSVTWCKCGLYRPADLPQLGSAVWNPPRLDLHRRPKQPSTCGRMWRDTSYDAHGKPAQDPKAQERPGSEGDFCNKCSMVVDVPPRNSFLQDQKHDIIPLWKRIKDPCQKISSRAKRCSSCSRHFCNLVAQPLAVVTNVWLECGPVVSNQLVSSQVMFDLLNISIICGFQSARSFGNFWCGSEMCQEMIDQVHELVKGIDTKGFMALCNKVCWYVCGTSSPDSWRATIMMSW